jgi:hypothetical protein
VEAQEVTERRLAVWSTVLVLRIFAAVPKPPLFESGHAPHRLDSHIQVARGPQELNDYVGSQYLEGVSIAIPSRTSSF